MIKGALHIHSDISPDSVLSRQRLKDIFKAAGYSFLLITEHAEDMNNEKYDILKREYQDLSDSKFLMIPGIEIKWKDKVHFLAYGAKNYMANESDATIDDTIRKIRIVTKCEFLAWAHFNHPWPVPRELVRHAALVDGIEIFNISYHGSVFPSYEGLRLINSMKKDGINVVALGGLDLHNPDRYKYLSCIIKEQDGLDRSVIFRHLKNGTFASKGIFYALRQQGHCYRKSELLYSWCVGKIKLLLDKIGRIISYGTN